MNDARRKAAGKRLMRALEALADEPGKLPNMTPKEINAFIAKVRRERRQKPAESKTRAVRRNPPGR